MGYEPRGGGLKWMSKTATEPLDDWIVSDTNPSQLLDMVKVGTEPGSSSSYKHELR